MKATYWTTKEQRVKAINPMTDFETIETVNNGEIRTFGQGYSKASNSSPLPSQYKIERHFRKFLEP